MTRDSQSPGDVGRHDVRLGGRGLAEPLEVLEAVGLVQRRAFQMLELGHAPELGHGAAPLVATLGPHLHQSELSIVTVSQPEISICYSGRIRGQYSYGEPIRAQYCYS